MRNLYYLFTLLALATLTACAGQKSQPNIHKKKLSKQERIEGAIQDRLFTSSDVETGVIPYDRLFNAIDEARDRVARRSLRRSMPGSISNPVWRERGPSNVGGRTRAIMIDESDPNRNRIWIGGVSGGLWRTEDVTKADPQSVEVKKV